MNYPINGNSLKPRPYVGAHQEDLADFEDIIFDHVLRQQNRPSERLSPGVSRGALAAYLLFPNFSPCVSSPGHCRINKAHARSQRSSMQCPDKKGLSVHGEGNEQRSLPKSWGYEYRAQDTRGPDSVTGESAAVSAGINCRSPDLILPTVFIF